MSDTVTEEKAETEEVVEENVQEPEVEAAEQEEKKEEFVPVSAHIAERKKRQEAEEKIRWYEQQMAARQPEAPLEDEDDLLTVGKQKQTLAEFKRNILEEAYMEQNPDLIEKIQYELPDLLKDPKYKWLADSIPQAPNRLQRAAQVYEMIKGKKEPIAQKAPDRSNTPRSPQGVAKSNNLSLADRLMQMSDQELEEWRLSQKRKVR